MSQEYDVKVVRDGTTLTDAVVTEDVFIDSSSYTTTPVLQLFLDYDDTVPATNRTPEYACDVTRSSITAACTFC